MEKGAYKVINEGLTAALAHCQSRTDIDEDEEMLSTDFPPDFAFIRSICSDLKTLDKALHGPDAKHWQEVLEYEISQLEKIETWDVGLTSTPNGNTL